MIKKHHFVDINIKNILYMLISFKFNYISNQIEKQLFGLIKFICSHQFNYICNSYLIFNYLIYIYYFIIYKNI